MAGVPTVSAAPYRELIAKQRVSQDMILLKTGITQTTVSEIMSGKAVRISTRTALALLRGLDGNIIIHQRGEEL